MIRQPIITILAHVDHGKTTLLDYIRHTTIAAREAGGITQSIGTTEVPIDVIKKQCASLLKKFNIEVKIPGLLFIDTPGHSAFSTMRERGGSIADIAVLLIDINEGLKPQTEECLQILKRSKVPFVVALNKIDKIHGWVSDDKCFLDNYNNQTDSVKGEFEKKFYKIVAQLSEHNFNVERFDRISDFTKTIAVVPISAKTGEGIPELLAILTGLAQQYLRGRLELKDRCKGLILEVKKVKGLGMTIDTIIYDGYATKNDYLVIAGEEPILTKIKALLLPQLMRDIRAEKIFRNVDSVRAACGVKISAPNLDKAVAGSKFFIVPTEKEAEKARQELEKDTKSVTMRHENGLILKADSLGSLEALIKVFENYNIKRTGIGQITKTDIIDAEANNDEFLKAVIGFNVTPSTDAVSMANARGVKIITSEVIYHLEEEYAKWKEEKKKRMEEAEIKDVTRPAKFRILPGCIFRASSPAIVGCEILLGLLRPGAKIFLSTDETIVGRIKQIQSEGNNLDQAKENDKVALSILDISIGRRVKEGDIFYTHVSSDEYKILKKHKDLLSASEKQCLEEIKQIKQSKDRFWGV
ncbi:MAG: translation initiation factor IF-2 [Candidatus Aenigmatarchaeota archaeon]|nr:MAG: translation initiation factor IF-2 [Candidatus Aenigmarchaeota archaeon]